LALEGHADAKEFVSINPATRAAEAHQFTHPRLVLGLCEESSMFSEQALAWAIAGVLRDNLQLAIVKRFVFRSFLECFVQSDEVTGTNRDETAIKQIMNIGTEKETIGERMSSICSDWTNMGCL